MPGPTVVLDGNEAAASIAYRTSEVIAIYPITPSSPMGELSDEWAAHRRPNLWGTVPEVIEMQSEGGAAGAVHGALQGGALTTTFTASQGLLLMIPNMYKIAGELSAFCMHVAARALATHALSIFGDHSDVMACRQTGFAMLCSGSVQEAHDLACVAHMATLACRVPFLHFFDGFRTSHELATIATVSDEALRSLIDDDLVAAHRARALTPDRPVLRGTAQNPDVFFQAREAASPFYRACVTAVEQAMARFAGATGRRYRLMDYVGHPEAERVVVAMGSGAETTHETVETMVARGARVGVLKVRLYRPFDAAALRAALPASTRAIAVLDRTKEPGAPGEPLFLDIAAALREVPAPLAGARLVGGRYGLGSKEFTPAMVRAVFAELELPRPRHGFTVGIVDDVSGSSLPVDLADRAEPDDVFRAVFYGLGADGTVSANKSSAKIVGDATGAVVQGYFVYDSKKSGAMTVSHLRFARHPIRSAYLIREAQFVACHHFPFLERLDVLDGAADGAHLLLNAPYPPEEVWARLPAEAQAQILAKRLRVHAIDATGLVRQFPGSRINTVMQACFFALADLLPTADAIQRMKDAIAKAYGKKGEAVVRTNHAAVDAALEHLRPVPVPEEVTATSGRPPVVPPAAPDFVQHVTAAMLANQGDLLPVSAFPVDGAWPLGTAQYEKRNIADAIPVWDATVCIQCNKCAMVCPHAAIRAKAYPEASAAGAPDTFKSVPYRGNEFPGARYTIQVAPEDCTGCTLCVMVCPAKDKANPRHKALEMAPQRPLRDPERTNYEFFLDLPPPPRPDVRLDVKNVQFFDPLFEYSGACAGCGETPYVKLVTQLFGDRALIANATGCSSIYGGNLPTTPYTTDRDGRGPAWSNSLFEDNAEFGLGMRLAVDRHRDEARRLLAALAPPLDATLVQTVLDDAQETEADIARQRERVATLRRALAGTDTPEARRLATLLDYLVRKSVWIVGGDGWAYDIGFGGLDHVLASGRDVNCLVLDTEVYSNTGGQQSKATPLGAAAKFAVAGKAVAKKDLGLYAMSYGTVYVARIAFGAKDLHTLKALLEAEAFAGPSLVIAYSHCIAHGYDMAYGLEQQKLAVASGHWPLFRYDPRRPATGQPALQLDSGPPSVPLTQYVRNEARYRMVEQQDATRFRRLMQQAQEDVRRHYAVYAQLAGLGADDAGQ